MRCARPRAWSRVPRAPPRNWAYLDRRSNQRLENSESTGIISRLRSFPFGLPGFCLPSNLYNFLEWARTDGTLLDAHTDAKCSAHAEISAWPDKLKPNKLN